MKSVNVAVVGATGAVGEQMLRVLDRREFPLASLRLLASERSAGKRVEFKGEHIPVDELLPESFEGVDIALFSAGGSVSEKFAPIAAEAGAVVVDNTSAFRMDPDVPLVVPEVNSHTVADYRKKGIIANPNCSTIQMVVVLKPLHDEATIERVVVSTYQATSGAGRSAMEELGTQTRALFNQQEYEIKKFPKRIAFNCLPQIGDFLPDGYTKEEEKMIRETVKIMEDGSIRITATAVRVPVFACHSEAVNIQFAEPITPGRARDILGNSPGIVLMDDPVNGVYPTGIDVIDSDDAYVGRVRKDPSVENGLDVWIVADNLRKGAATNAVQIAEILVEKYL